MSDLFVDNIKHQSSQGSGTITIGASGEAVDLGATAGGTLTNRPAFSVYKASSQGIANATTTKLQFDTKNFDTDNAFDTSTNYRFTVPSGKAGKYYLETYISIPNIDDTEFGQVYLSVNGDGNENLIRIHMSGANQFFRQICSAILDLSVGDYVEVKVYQTSGGTQNAVNHYFAGYRLIGV